ncbi:Cysteine desulfurase IscS [Geodia barretti]|uniref:cysteine desulfurase n=1 Tax=Geodia barretti TaxID=519541 RepID=A0AA35QR96_GEOBA|nr:Cysteine desulfurase IscS [Geodia barretti]
MLPFFTEQFGNSASKHAFGWEAEAAVHQARKNVGSLIGAAPKEIVFTSGATESDNLAIKGVAELYGDRKDHIITCAAEHKAVLDCCKFLEHHGYRVTYLPVDAHGTVDLDKLRAAIDDKTLLISIMAANNEVGKMPIDVAACGIHLLSMTAHKLHGPKGVGALYVSARKPPVRLSPTIHGGGHEGGMRSGTLNVPGIVGFGKACELARTDMATELPHITSLRDRLETSLFERLDELHLNGHPTERLCGNLNVAFGYVEGESLIMGLNDVAVSSGSTCTSAALEPSHVLKAMGVRGRSRPRLHPLRPGSIQYRGRGALTAYRKNKMATAVQITEQAANRIKELLGQDERELTGLRLKVVGGGCSGLQYKMDLDNPKPTTACFEEEGAKVIVDLKSLLYLGGTELDYRETLMEAAFVFQNPNVKRSCGCGASFVV